MWHSRPASTPHPPIMANAILNFHFDFLNPSLIIFPLKKHIHINKHPCKTVFKTEDPFPQAKKQKTGIQINAQAQEIQKVTKESSDEYINSIGG